LLQVHWSDITLCELNKEQGKIGLLKNKYWKFKSKTGRCGRYRFDAIFLVQGLLQEAYVRAQKDVVVEVYTKLKLSSHRGTASHELQQSGDGWAESAELSVAKKK
jgi:hypothetical protein